MPPLLARQVEDRGKLVLLNEGKDIVETPSTNKLTPSTSVRPDAENETPDPCTLTLWPGLTVSDPLTTIEPEVILSESATVRLFNDAEPLRL